MKDGQRGKKGGEHHSQRPGLSIREKPAKKRPSKKKIPREKKKGPLEKMWVRKGTL